MRDQPGFPLPLIVNGINSSREKADVNLKTALDVYEEDGTLRVRKAWASVGSGPVVMRACGLAYLAFGDEQASALIDADRAFLSSALAADDYLFIGSINQFDGFDWSAIIGVSSTITTSRILAIDYWLGSAQDWEPLPWFLDQTQGVLNGASIRCPLLKSGKVHFHRPTGWTDDLAIDSQTAFWLRVRPVARGNGLTSNAPAWTGMTFEVSQPGVRVFDRAPVNGLVATQIRRSIQAVVCADNTMRGFPGAVSNDRSSVGQLESGALIGRWDLSGAPTKDLGILKRWTGGLWGSVVMPAGSSGGSQGTASRFTDLGPTGLLDGYPATLYDARPPLVIAVTGGTPADPGIAPSGAGSTTSFATTEPILLEYASHAFERFIIVCTVSGGGPAVGEAREIALSGVGGGSTTFLVNPPWSGAPSATSRFIILKPAHFLAAKGNSPTDYGEYLIAAVGSARVLRVDLNSYSPDPVDVFGASEVLHFAIMQSTRYTLEKGDRYSFCSDPKSGELIISNGSRLLSFDGEWLKDLKSAREDDPRAEALLGALPAVGPGNTNDPRTLAYEAGFYLSPPAGAFLATHLTHVFVGGGAGAPNRIRWSAAGAYSDFWPKGVNWETNIRDSDGRPLRGLVSYYDRLIAFTDSSIHEGVPIPQGGFSFRQVAGSTGFTSNAAVCRVEIGSRDVLIGPSPSGLFAYAGGEPVPLIERWGLIVPAPGVDTNDLANAPACVWKQANLYLLGIKVKGETSRQRILVYDYKAKRAWLWTAPYGVASLTVVSSPSGEEEVLLGTEDGLLMTLVEGETDDGSPLSGSFETHALTPSKTGESVELGRVTIEARVEQGAQAAKVVGLTVRRNEASQRWTTGNVPMGTGEAVFGTAVFGTATFAPGDFGRREVNMPNGTVGRSFSLELSLPARARIRGISLDATTMSRER
jgi:hypothetical protein